MTGAELSEAINTLGISRAEFADEMKVSERTALRWIASKAVSGPVRCAVNAWLDLHKRHLPWRKWEISIPVARLCYPRHKMNIEQELIAARAEIEAMFAESRMASANAYENKSDGSWSQHTVIYNGKVKPAGERGDPLPADWLADTKATIAEMYPDHANMRLVWRCLPEHQKWDACTIPQLECDAGEGFRIRIHAERLNVHPVYEDDLNNVQGY